MTMGADAQKLGEHKLAGNTKADTGAADASPPKRAR
jgi:hypothetical protein